MNTIVELKNLTKSFGGVKAVDNVSMDFEKSKITALIGPNGAGKTTIFNIINGFIKPDKGQVLFEGKDITGLPPYKIAKKGIGRLFQDIRIFNKLTVLENVLVAIEGQSGENFSNAIFHRKKLIKEEKENIEKAKELLDFVKLSDKKDVFAENLSYGQQKLLSIARILAQDSKVLLLDEPTAGVNPVLIDSIIEVIKKLPEKEKTIILIEHNINVVLEISDWVFLLDEGRVASFGLPDEVLSDPVTREVYLGV
jgi:ABC-type branched-subunit amino acid transport system ATPase component